MLDKFGGYKTQVRQLERQLKELDPSKTKDAAKMKEVSDLLKNLKEIIKDKEDKRDERRKKKEEAAKPAEVEATVVPTAVVKESLTTPTEEVTKEADVNKFAIDSKVEPIRGTQGSVGVVIREAGVNGDPLVYVKWTEGALKQAHGEYGAYYPSDLRLKAEEIKAEINPNLVPRENLQALEADLKSNYESSIKHLEEEIEQAKSKADMAWLGRLEEKLNDIKKAYQNKFEKKAIPDSLLKCEHCHAPMSPLEQSHLENLPNGDQKWSCNTKKAEDENGSGGTERLKVYDMTPPYDKDPQEKSTGYGGDRPYGANVGPNGQDNSLPLEGSLKQALDKMDPNPLNMADKYYCNHCGYSGKDFHFINVDKDPSKHSGLACPKCHKEVALNNPKHSSLNKNSINITVGEKLFIVNPLAKTADNEYVYDVNLADNSKLFKITSKDEMGQEHLIYVIGKELTKEASADKLCAVCGTTYPSFEEYNKHKKEKHSHPKPVVCPECGKHVEDMKQYGQHKSTEHKTPTIAKLVSNLAFLKKGSFVSILDVDNNKKQIKFASLDNSLRGWAPLSKFAAMNVPEASLVPHEDHKDEVLSTSGNELLVTCPANSTNVTWRTIEAPPATPESLNDMDLESSKDEKCPQCKHPASEHSKGGFCSHKGYACGCSAFPNKKEAAQGYPETYFKYALAKERADQFGLDDVEDADLTQAGLVAKKQEMIESHDIESAQNYKPGTKARISGGSGIDSDKIVTIVDRSLVKTDGRGIPTNVAGAYKPVDWNREVAFQYEDGSIGTMFKNRLMPVEQNLESAVSCPYCNERIQSRKPGAMCEGCGKPVPEDIINSTKESAKECPDCHGTFEGAEGSTCPTCGRFAVQKDALKQQLPQQILPERSDANASMKQAAGCDQCDAAMINGVFCHETGCPNKRKEREQEDMEMESAYSPKLTPPAKHKPACNKCEPRIINGIPEHSADCPDKGKKLDFFVDTPFYEGGRDGDYSKYYEASLNKSAHIRHEDGKWIVYNHDYKKKLGTYDTKEEALKRLRQIEYFKHQGSLQPLSKKEARKESKCIKCDKQLPVEDMIENVHGAGYLCKEHAKEWNKDASLKKADQDLSLEQQVAGFKERMQMVNDRLANPPAKTADLETTQDLSNVSVEDLSSAILHTIDLLESKVGEDVSADPELHPMLENLENKVYEIEMKMGIKPNLPEHERLEPEHKEIVKELGEEVDKQAAMPPMPSDSASLPPDMEYVLSPDGTKWIKKVKGAGETPGNQGTLSGISDGGVLS